MTDNQPLHLSLLARELANELAGKAFLSLERLAITRRLRALSGKNTTRIKAVMARRIEQELSKLGIRCFPSLATTTTGATIRLFHQNTVAAELLEVLIDPSPRTDRQLAVFTMKVKGPWRRPARASA